MFFTQATSEARVEAKGAHGVQSAETVLEVLNAFVGIEPTPMLKTLAARTNMHPAKVHRYLVSLCRLGYVEQDVSTNRYRLGPAAFRLTFAAVESIDVIRVARPLMANLCQQVGHCLVLAIWHSGRPTIAIKATLPGSISPSAVEGAALPLLRSSLGTVFAAWMPRSQTRALIATELATLRPDRGFGMPSTMEEVDSFLTEVRRRGMARTQGQMDSSTHSLASSVFNGSGEVAGALCALGLSGKFDSSWGSPTARALVDCAETVGRGLGCFDGRY